jgi:small-conductance mechanosensitive channel
MKDILENFIYGLSLMSGRVRVGDYIECDGILGKVESIGYQSTQIVTLDGSMIAFLNTSLFNKNFKNFTKNHSYEYVKLPIGVAYGVKVDEVRELLETNLNTLNDTTSVTGRPVIQKKQGFKVFFGDFGESSVDLIVAFWVLVEEKINFVYKVKETIYNTLQDNSIEIPFPQRDIYIKQVAGTSSDKAKKK